MPNNATKSKALYRTFTTLLAFFLVLYIGYQTFRSIVSGIETEMAVDHSVYEAIDTVGLVFRSETVIPDIKNGSVFYMVNNGTHVAKNGTIASVYANAGDGLLERQIGEIDEQIAMLRGIGNEESASHVTLDIINAQLSDAINTMVFDVRDGVFTDNEQLDIRLLSLLSKKQMVTGEHPDFSGTIQKLQTRRNELNKQLHKAKSVLKAPVAGYFADRTDGYESLLENIQPETLDVKRLSDLLSMEPPTPAPSSGKIVSGYEWYMACVVPETYYNALSVGTLLSLKLSFVSDEDIPVSVAACNKGADGSLAVIFRCAYMSVELSTIRRESVQIQLVRHTGLKVPKKAIVISDDMQPGVYIRFGNTIVFRKIEQEFSEPADYVICTPHTDSEYLQLYDDIIVSGRGLYDGKIIH